MKLDLKFAAFFFLACLPTSQASECVRVFYDAGQNFGDHSGLKFVVALQNVLGHFPKLQQIVAPIETYKRGQLNECKANIYIANLRGNPVPKDFLADYATSSRNVAWLGYSIDQLGEKKLQTTFGYRFKGIDDLDKVHLDRDGNPSFFKNVIYHGETFWKSIDAGAGGVFYGSFRMMMLEKTSEVGTQVLAEAVHSFSGVHLPYILRNKNRFYVADNPFHYIHLDDRYLVFTDLIFDILGEQPIRTGKMPAVLRIEDVHPCTRVSQLDDILSVTQEFHIPFHIALIPIWANPFNVPNFCANGTFPMNEKIDFVQTLLKLRHGGASIVWHGVTHQYENEKNPFDGISGDDAEFLNFKTGSPVALDSPDWVLSRLDRGWEAITKSGLSSQIWEVPHYEASVLDYLIFARVFSWTIGKVQYWPYVSSGLPSSQSSSLWFEKSGLSGSSERKEEFHALSAQADPKNAIFQGFPYEIYGDIYGQRVIPENMGFPVTDGLAGDTIDIILERARRNRVLRDIWGSFFYHPHRLGDIPGNEMQKDKLRRMIRTMISYGYEFIDLEQFIKDKKNIMRPDPIVVN